MNKKLAVLGIIGLTICYFYLKPVGEVRYETDVLTPPPAKNPQANLTTTAAKSEPTAEDSARLVSDDLKTLRASFPEENLAKSEVVEDPHKTPPSIINFAVKLGPLLEKGLKNVDDASLLLGELHECVTNAAAAQSARALCLSTAGKLGSAHPQLKEKVEEITAAADPEVVRLLQKKNALLK